VTASFTCIVCPRGCWITVRGEPGSLEVSGNACARGLDYALREIEAPVRSLTTTVRTTFRALPRLPVRTAGEIPLSLFPEAMKALDSVTVGTRVRSGDAIMENLAGSGVAVVATDSIDEEVV
jgi:CxxC motif-containing protein